MTINHPIPSASPNIDDEDDGDHYDRLHGPQKNMAAILESYDQLEPSESSGHQPAYSSAEVRVRRSESNRSLVGLNGGKVQQKQGNDNQAYEVTDVKGIHKPLFRISQSPPKSVVEDRGVYFELEADRSSRDSMASMSSVLKPSHQDAMETSLSKQTII